MIIPGRFPFFKVAILIQFALLASGCANWKQNPGAAKQIQLPPNPMKPDAVVLDVAVAQIDNDQRELLLQLWNQLDHQAIPLATRKLLDQNGLLVGVIPPKPPELFVQLLQDKSLDTSKLQPWQQQLAGLEQNKRPSLILHERIQNDEGQPHQVPVSERMPVASWTVTTFDSQTTGQDEQVRGHVRIVTYPNGDGRVAIELVPEIHHGRQRPTIGVADQAFFFRNRQAIQELGELGVTVSLRPGETLMMGPSPQLTDLGGLLFGHGQRNDFWHRLLLIRLVHTQHDDLFDAGGSR